MIKLATDESSKQITVTEYLHNSHAVFTDSRKGICTTIVGSKGEVVATVGTRKDDDREKR